MSNFIPKSQHKPLSVQELSAFYVQLVRLEKSGIPLQEALAMLFQNKGEIGKRAKIAFNSVKRGKPFSEAGIRAGLFIGLDAALVQVADAGGTHTEVFQQLAQFYEEKAKQIRQLKAKLWLPSIVLLLALFIQPIPTLILGQITFWGYLEATIGLILQLALVIFILWHLPKWLRHSFFKFLGINRLVDKWQIKFPYLGAWTIRQQVRNFLRALGLMLQAGLPIMEALPKAYEVVENLVLRQYLHQIIRYLQKGQTFTEALSQIEGLDPIAIQLMSTGEQTGSLAEMMLHYVKLESEEIARHNERLTVWIPRIVYAFIAAWIIYGILNIGSMTVIPNNL